MDKIYLVRHCGGSYEDSWDNVIFATISKKNAQKYVQKYNRVLEKWKVYYSQFEDKRRVLSKNFHRWHQINSFINCYFEEIDVR